jgi:hypothetical protein
MFKPSRMALTFAETPSSNPNENNPKQMALCPVLTIATSLTPHSVVHVAATHLAQRPGPSPPSHRVPHHSSPISLASRLPGRVYLLAKLPSSSAPLLQQPSPSMSLIFSQCVGNHFSMLQSLGGDEDRDGVMAAEKVLVSPDD